MRGQTRRGVIEATRQGLPVSGVEELLKSGRLTLAEVDRIVLPRKTLSHRRKIGRLTPEQSDRLVRAVRVLAAADETFGSQDKAFRWLRRPTRVLEAKPRSKCSTPPKAQGRWKTSFIGSTMASPCDDGLADLSAAVRGSLR
jgi:putative toxin-antitoxin system antitoxin component (TIGR02293 family)